MTRSRIPFALFAMALVLALGTAGSAVAATSSTAPKPLIAPAPKGPPAPGKTTAPTPYRTGTIEVQIWPQADSSVPTQAVVISDVTLPSDVDLPAIVEIPIVPGTTVQWAGESLGGAPDADPQRPFKIVDGAGGGKYAQFTLSKSVRGQIDTIGVPLHATHDAINLSADWIQSTEASSVLFTVRFPGGSSRIQIDPKPAGDPVTNMSGETLYALPAWTPTHGAKQTITVSYSTNPSGEQGMTAGTKTTVYVVLGGLLVVALAVLAFMFARNVRSGGGGTGDAEDDEADVEDDEPGVEEDEPDVDDPFDDLIAPEDED